jgi:hypothetical protein
MDSIARNEGREISVLGGGDLAMTPALNPEKMERLILGRLILFTFLFFCQGGNSTPMATQ